MRVKKGKCGKKGTLSVGLNAKKQKRRKARLSRCAQKNNEGEKTLALRKEERKRKKERERGRSRRRGKGGRKGVREEAKEERNKKKEMRVDKDKEVRM